MIFSLCGADDLKRFFFFFFNDTATTEIYTLSLHDALPILNKTVNKAVNIHTCSWMGLLMLVIQLQFK